MKARTAFILLYTWIVTIFFGAVLLDIVYSRLISDAATAFSAVSDFLLHIGFVTFLAAIGAIAFAWNSRFARNLLIASLAILSFEFLIPALFSQLFQSAQEIPISPWIRLVPSGLASILAFIGLHRYYRQ